MRRKNGVGKAISHLTDVRFSRDKELKNVHRRWDHLIERAEEDLRAVCDHFYLVKDTLIKFAEWPDGGSSKDIYVCPDCKEQFDWSPPFEDDIDWREIDPKKKLYQKVSTKPRKNYLE